MRICLVLSLKQEYVISFNGYYFRSLGDQKSKRANKSSEHSDDLTQISSNLLYTRCTSICDRKINQYPKPRYLKDLSSKSDQFRRVQLNSTWWNGNHNFIVCRRTFSGSLRSSEHADAFLYGRNLCLPGDRRTIHIMYKYYLNGEYSLQEKL